MCKRNTSDEEKTSELVKQIEEETKKNKEIEKAFNDALKTIYNISKKIISFKKKLKKKNKMCKIRRFNYNWLLFIFFILSVVALVALAVGICFKVTENYLDCICFCILGGIALICTTILICFVVKALEKREKHAKDIVVSLINERENTKDSNTKQITVNFCEYETNIEWRENIEDKNNT